MWIIITGVILTSPLILFYLVNDCSSIVIDKKNRKIIILNKTPPAVIKFADLIKVDLLINGTKTGIADIKAKQKIIKKTDSICLKIITTNVDNPLYVYFNSSKLKKTNFEYNTAGKRAVTLYNKLSQIINSPVNLQAKSISRHSAVEFQLKKLKEFERNIIRQSAS